LRSTTVFHHLLLVCLFVVSCSASCDASTVLPPLCCRCEGGLLVPLQCFRRSHKCL
uniref:Uncharacterized protein n=1 Tax=Neogobius melanostomus TaxID=47308 RepID=A0A8C6S6Z9_9GOBI